MYKSEFISGNNLSISFNLKHERRNTIKNAIHNFFSGKSPSEKFWALRKVSFSIKQGETVGVIGRNGSGKSTLLRIIAGIYTPDEGSIVVSGRTSTLLSLTAGFQPELSGFDNIFLSGLLLGVKKKTIETLMKDIASFSELNEFLDVPVKKYSSGMVARLGFSIAIHIEHDILLVDEALAVGDSAFRKKCEDRMLKLKNEGKTIILVTHSTDMVRNFCDTALWLEKGNVRLAGSAHDVAQEYSTFMKTK